jgi:hypothetical protein
MSAMRTLLVLALLASDAHAIVNGDPSSDPSVVALVRGEDGAEVLVCSGTVIASHAVLTAAHCVADDNDLPDVMIDGDRIRPSIVFVAPGFDAATLADDVAVLVVDRTLSPAPRSLALSAPAIGATIDLVGFGRTAPGDITPFAQRTGAANVTESSTGGLVTRGPAFTCEGDSGGPALIDGAIAGITSSGDCGAFSRHARVLDHLEFIEGVVAQTRPRFARAGDRCWYSTNCLEGEGECRPAPDDSRLSFCTPYCIHSACPDDLACVDALCVHPAPSPGANGSTCATDDECVDELCAAPDGDDARVCARRCFTDLPGFNCAEGSRCEPAAGGGEACFVDAAESGCCSSSRGGAVGSLVLALLVLGQLLRGRVTP